MRISRRQLSLLLPMLGTADAAEKQPPAQRLPSKNYHHEQMPYTGTEQKKGRRFFYGTNRSDFRLEMHETILAPGTQTHAPHKHEHEEIVIVVEGTVEAYLEGKTETVHPGSVIYFASNEMHSARNVGSTPSRYYVIELRGDEA